MIVPDQGSGRVWQASLSLGRVRVALAGVAGLAAALGVAAVVQVSTFSRVAGHDRLVGENLDLKARLEAVDRRLADIEPMIERVRAYDDQLRALDARGALPGYGELDPEEWAARQRWIAGVVGGAEGTGDPASAVERVVVALEDVDLDHLQEVIDRLQRSGDAMPQLWPVEGVVTSLFGWRRAPYGTHRWKHHDGVDIGAAYGTPILATADGLVTWADWDSGCGRAVVLDHGSGVSTRYCHASSVLVATGDEVYAGDMIALVGSTGLSTGPHLHYELLLDDQKVDPLPYLARLAP